MSKAYIYRPTSDLADQLTTVDEVLTKWGAAIPEFAGWVRDMKYRFSEEACWMAGRAVEWGDIAASKDCIAFAAKNNPSLWLLTPWWKYQAKRLLGGFFAKRIRRMLHPKTAESPGPFTIYAPFKHGETFGWWPETQQ